ncbi:MAG: hypothetical protein D8M58_06710 [Calditrichaeota bacterium]|nr:MAG: hypothetical protein DWQ03_19790 [Calditrichota bacterium]MBL1205069.1 hypothetical protein [Calditrichota bacterium]NOG44899.1 BcpO-related WXXGXW repeat protein [Calditrichota bacterium]
MKLLKNILFAIFISLFFAGNANSQIIVTKKPNKPKVLVVKTKQPGSNYVWINGHWKVHKNKYVWKKGHWVKARKHHVWIPGHWKEVRKGWKWIPGHWKNLGRKQKR